MPTTSRPATVPGIKPPPASGLPAPTAAVPPTEVKQPICKVFFDVVGDEKIFAIQVDRKANGKHRSNITMDEPRKSLHVLLHPGSYKYELILASGSQMSGEFEVTGDRKRMTVPIEPDE